MGWKLPHTPTNEPNRARKLSEFLKLIKKETRVMSRKRYMKLRFFVDMATRKRIPVSSIKVAGPGLSSRRKWLELSKVDPTRHSRMRRLGLNWKEAIPSAKARPASI